MSKIDRIHGRQILDSRGNPTLEVEVTLRSGAAGRAGVPSGASTGQYEAVELRDGDDAWNGLGVTKAVTNVNGEIAAALTGSDASGQEEIDKALIALDGTEDKGRLGANALLGVSVAVAKAAALEEGIPLYRYLGGESAHVLPVPMMNVLNGGVHADNRLDLQEFMIVPVGAKSFSEAVRMCVETFHALKGVLKKRGLNTSVGDEGGFAPNLESNEDALRALVDAVETAGYSPESDLNFAVDAAASEFYERDRYVLENEGRELDADQLAEFWEELAGRYPLVVLEDGMDEEDWSGWQILTKRLGDRLQLVGDDIFVTNPDRIERGIRENAANAVLIKLNQIGTVTETLEAVRMAQKAGWATVISHRSGETEDVTIADLAVATGTGQIKTGAPCRSERVAKYNQLLRIEEELGADAEYPGRRIFARVPA